MIAKIQIVVIIFLVISALSASSNKAFPLAPVSALLSFFMVWIVHHFISKPFLIVLSIVLGAPLIALVVSAVDPENSFRLFIFGTLFNLLFMPFFYAANFRGKQMFSDAPEVSLPSDELEQKYQKFKGVVIPVSISAVVLLLVVWSYLR